jgi:hypothetical protein
MLCRRPLEVVHEDGQYRPKDFPAGYAYGSLFVDRRTHHDRLQQIRMLTVSIDHHCRPHSALWQEVFIGLLNPQESAKVPEWALYRKRLEQCLGATDGASYVHNLTNFTAGCLLFGHQPRINSFQRTADNRKSIRVNLRRQTIAIFNASDCDA